MLSISNKQVLLESLEATPEELFQKTKEILNQIQALSKEIERMKYLVKITQGHWAGDAGDQFRTAMKKQIEKMERTIERYRNDVHTLNQFSQDILNTTLDMIS